MAAMMIVAIPAPNVRRSVTWEGALAAGGGRASPICGARRGRGNGPARGLGIGAGQWHLRTMRPMLASIVGLAGFLIYVVAILLLGDHVLALHWVAQFFFFALAGTLWVIPARWLLVWGAAAPRAGQRKTP